MPSQTAGYLIDPTTGTLSIAAIHDPADRLGHDTGHQMQFILSAKTFDVLPFEIAGVRYLAWHDALCFEGYATGLITIDKSPFLAGRCMIFADDGKTPDDADATPFGLTPQIAITDLAKRVTCYRPVIIPRLTNGAPTGFDLALERSKLTVVS